MTNFETSASKVCLLKCLEAGMTFHFLSSIGITSSDKFFVHWIRLNFRTASHEFATDLSNSSAELVGLWSGSLRCNYSTWRFFPRHIFTQEVRSFVVVEGIRISIPLMPSYCMIRTWRTGPGTVCPGIVAQILELLSSRRSVCSLHAGVRSPKPSSTSGTVL